MLRFTTLNQETPHVRPAQERRQDFQEILDPFAIQKAAEQASRCSQCGVPFCQVHCPLHNNIPDWLRLTAEGRLQEAYELASMTNTFPEICGRICPQDRLCEGNCVIEADFNSVTIGAIEKYVTETAWKEGWIIPFPPKAETGLSVGIIGAGPAGLAAAEQLRRKGHEVHLYDRYDRVGGLMIYGIPNFKLDKAVVARRHQQYAQSGIHFHLNHPIDSADAFQAVRHTHDAVLIATGVYKAKELPELDRPLEGVIPAMRYLTASNRHGLGDSVADFTSLNAHGKRVVVIGGGDTAMDCVRTAVRQGATSVTCLYRRDRENMPGSRREVKYAEEEGVEFRWLSAPKSFVGTSRAEAIIVQKMQLGAPDAGGRRQPEPIPGEEVTLDADLIILALGFDADDLPTAFGQQALTVQRSGTLKVDASGMTSLPGVFAAGDIVRGASLVVWAIADGRDVARNIHTYLKLRAMIKAA